MRTAYDAIVRSVGRYRDTMTPEHMDATKKLAEEMWARLQVLASEQDEHRRTHRP
ncbi:MAG TPA: hypothetical protein VG897_17095 [Terriglobales bacterium]|nr:hypothetical protein [Terriglobales bacterium]